MGREKLQRAKERLDFRTAQVGAEMIIDNDAPELVDAPRESREVAVHPADDGRLAETPSEELVDAEVRTSDRRFNTPDRKPAVKRRGPEHFSIGDEQDSKFRCVDDSPDTQMAPSDSGIDIDSMTEISAEKKQQDEVDQQIIRACILGVDITEVYSPDRVNEVARRWGLRPGSSMDLTNGYDFTKASDRKRAWDKIKEEDPFLLIGSPPCTLFSILQELNLVVNRDKPGWLEEFERRKAEAIEHIRFCCTLYDYQLKRGKHFLHEHPWTARSWKLDFIQDLLNDERVHLVEGHMCDFGMTSHVNGKHGERGLVKKPTGFMTSSYEIAQLLNRKCSGGHQHVPLVGGRAAGAQVYPEMLCQAIVDGMLRQKNIDESNRVSTMEMSRGQLNLFSQRLHEEVRRERSHGRAGNCSSVVREGSINKPMGNWPADWVDTVHEEDGGDDSLGVRPQSGVEVLKDCMFGLICKNSIWQAWDDVSNAVLNPDDVKAARALEMQYFEKLRVYDRVDRSEIAKTGGKLIGTRWVDVNKGDGTNIDYRSRLVGRDDALYAATPPLEALRLIISNAATTPGGDQVREVMVNDVRRAYFYAKIDRDVFVELHEEDPEHGSGKVGKLRLCLYGTVMQPRAGWRH